MFEFQKMQNRSSILTLTELFSFIFGLFREVFVLAIFSIYFSVSNLKNLNILNEFLDAEENQGREPAGELFVKIYPKLIKKF